MVDAQALGPRVAAPGKKVHERVGVDEGPVTQVGSEFVHLPGHTVWPGRRVDRQVVAGAVSGERDPAGVEQSSAPGPGTR